MNKKQIVLTMLIIGILSSGIGCIETGTGSSVDTIQGIEHEGLLWKTWSVWLTNDHPTETYSAIYSVKNGDTEVLKALEVAHQTGNPVRVYYRNELIYMPWEYSSDVIIYKVESINQ